MNGLVYKGYVAEIVVDVEARVLHGRVLGLTDVITFEGETIDQAEHAFRESIDDYLAFCSSLDQAPARPFGGKILFRTTPDQHRRFALAALRTGKSVNAWIEATLDRAADSGPAHSLPIASTGAASDQHPPGMR